MDERWGEEGRIRTFLLHVVRVGDLVALAAHDGYHAVDLRDIRGSAVLLLETFHFLSSTMR